MINSSAEVVGKVDKVLILIKLLRWKFNVRTGVHAFFYLLLLLSLLCLFWGGGVGAGGGGLSSAGSFQLQSRKRSHGKAIGCCSLQELQKLIVHKEKTQENTV